MLTCRLDVRMGFGMGAAQYVQLGADVPWEAAPVPSLCHTANHTMNMLRCCTTSCLASTSRDTCHQALPVAGDRQLNDMSCCTAVVASKTDSLLQALFISIALDLKASPGVQSRIAEQGNDDSLEKS